jgi:hypothetical protein
MPLVIPRALFRAPRGTSGRAATTPLAAWSAVSGDLGIRIRVDEAAGPAGPAHEACTSAHTALRPLTVRPRAPHERVRPLVHTVAVIVTVTSCTGHHALRFRGTQPSGATAIEGRNNLG